MYDRSGGLWRVVYYGPSPVGEHVRKLDRRARAGSQRARDELAALEEVRVARAAPELREALDFVLFAKATPDEVDEVTRYILARTMEPAA